MDRGALNLCLACRDVTAEAASGLVRAVCDLATGLAELGHAVTLLTDASAPAQLPGVEVRTIRAGRAPGPFADAQPESAAQNLLHAGGRVRRGAPDTRARAARRRGAGAAVAVGGRDLPA